jgi:hypothetical protein
VAHGTDGKEVAFVTLSLSGTVFEELAADHAGGRNHDILPTHGGGNSLNSLFAGERVVVLLDILQFVAVESILLDD